MTRSGLFATLTLATGLYYTELEGRPAALLDAEQLLDRFGYDATTPEGRAEVAQDVFAMWAEWFLGEDGSPWAAKELGIDPETEITVDIVESQGGFYAVLAEEDSE